MTPVAWSHLTQWTEDTCTYAVAFQILNLLDLEIPCAPEKFVAHVDDATGLGEGASRVAKVSAYLRSRGLHELMINPVVADWMVASDGFDHFRALLEQQLGPETAAEFTRDMFDGLVGECTGAAPAETLGGDDDLSSVVTADPSQEILLDMLNAGFLVIVSGWGRVDSTLGVVGHSVLVHRVEDGRLQVYDPAPEGPTTLTTAADLSEFGGVLWMCGYGRPA